MTVARLSDEKERHRRRDTRDHRDTRDRWSHAMRGCASKSDSQGQTCSRRGARMPEDDLAFVLERIAVANRKFLSAAEQAHEPGCSPLFCKALCLQYLHCGAGIAGLHDALTHLPRTSCAEEVFRRAALAVSKAVEFVAGELHSGEAEDAAVAVVGYLHRWRTNWRLAGIDARMAADADWRHTRISLRAAADLVKRELEEAVRRAKAAAPEIQPAKATDVQRLKCALADTERRIKAYVRRRTQGGTKSKKSGPKVSDTHLEDCERVEFLVREGKTVNAACEIITAENLKRNDRAKHYKTAASLRGAYTAWHKRSAGPR